MSFSAQGSAWGEYVLMDVINSTKLILQFLCGSSPMAHRRLWEQTTSKSTVHILGPSVPTKQERNQKKRKKKKRRKKKIKRKRKRNLPHKRTLCTAQDKTFPWTFKISIKPIYLNSPPETTRAALIAR